MLLCARYRHIEQTALLLDLGKRIAAVHGRKHLVLHANDYHIAEFQTLGGMHRHQRDSRRVVVIAAVLIRRQLHHREEICHRHTAFAFLLSFVDKLLHGDENVVCADDGYTGVEKRSEHADREVIWQVAARRSTYKMLDKRSALYKAKRKIEKAKEQVRAKVEPPFRVIKRQFGYTKVRFRGLVKNTAQLVTLFALSNLWMARRHLLASAGEVRL